MNDRHGGQDAGKATDHQTDTGRDSARGTARAPGPDRLTAAASQGYRPAVQAIARLIATDRRAALLASEEATVLLVNTPAKRLGLTRERLLERLDWQATCARARRAGSAPVSLALGRLTLEGELVYLPLGPAAGYFLRVAETDSESTWLRNRARAATLMRVAHDLRTPIQSLLATAEGLVHGGVRSDAALGQLRSAAELSLDHITNVLAVIRGEQSVMGGQPDVVFSTADELGALVEVVRPLAERRGAVLRLEIAEDAALPVIGPVRFVRALFQNMIDNAVKYGGAEIEMSLSVRPLEGTLDDPVEGAEGVPDEGAQDQGTGPGDMLAITFALRDMGGGIAPDQKERLRLALGQAAPDTLAGGGDPASGQAPVPARAPQAAGGMNVLAHALVQLGGQLEIEDRLADDPPAEGEAARVIGTLLRARFSLPRAQIAHFAEDGAPVPASGAALKAAPDAPAADTDAPQAAGVLAGHDILVVEDSPVSAAWLVHLLRAAGAGVTHAGTAFEALQILDGAGADPDLVLTDISLPQMNGVEFARRLRAARTPAPGAEPARARLPVVGLTAHVDARIRAACLAAGMVRVLEKPIRPDALRSALAEVLAEGLAEGVVPPDSPALEPRSSELQSSELQSPDAPGALTPPSELFAELAVDDLVSGLGRATALQFMARALAEVDAALALIGRDGIGDGIVAVLHAATGGCGMTGLSGVERQLRRLEDLVKEGVRDLDAPIADLRRTSEDSAAWIARWQAELPSASQG